MKQLRRTLARIVPLLGVPAGLAAAGVWYLVCLASKPRDLWTPWSVLLVAVVSIAAFTVALSGRGPRDLLAPIAPSRLMSRMRAYKTRLKLQRQWCPRKRNVASVLNAMTAHYKRHDARFAEFMTRAELGHTGAIQLEHVREASPREWFQKYRTLALAGTGLLAGIALMVSLLVVLPTGDSKDARTGPACSALFLEVSTKCLSSTAKAKPQTGAGSSAGSDRFGFGQPPP